MEQVLDIEAEVKADQDHLEATAIFKKADQPVILKVYMHIIFNRINIVSIF